MFIAITTYGNPLAVFNQVMNMYNENNIYFIHYNKRENYSDFKKLKIFFYNYNNVKVYSKYRIYWGELSIVKSMLYSMREFLKSDHNNFIHIGAKEINLHSIEYIENYIIQNSYTSINLDRKYLDWYENNICKDRNVISSINYDIFYKRKFHKYIYRYKDVRYFGNFVLLITAIFSNLFSFNIWKVIKSLFSFNIYKVTKQAFHYMDDENEVQKNIWYQFSKREKKIPSKLKNINFIPRMTVGPYIVLDRIQCNKIIGFKELHIFTKFCKNILAPEETFFNTLLFNLLDVNINNTFSLSFNYSENGLPLIPAFMKFSDFLFMRRFVGFQDDYSKFNRILKIEQTN